MNNKIDDEYMDIAIIGMAGRFPMGGSVEEYWENLIEGKECITHNTKENSVMKAGYEVIHSYGKVDGMYEFDNEFFEINKKEAIKIDPQERKILEISYEAIEDAGINLDKYDGKIGIICGSNENEYALKIYYEKSNNNIMNEISKMYLGSSLASRAAYKLNLTGPCIAIKDTCATALAAVHTSCQMLLNFEADVILAGAVNLSLNNENYAYVEGGITSQNGSVKAFSKDSGGCVPGDGIGMIVLKRLSDAKKDKDNIIAVIKGSALCNDGNRKMGFTAPSIDGEYETIMTAIGASGVKNSEIDYIESHGTATELGDMVEIKALKKAFTGASKNSIVLGAVKNNVGHLNYAAGCAGLIKAALVLNKRVVPPVINVDELKDELKDTPFYINKEVKKLTKKGPLRAGVSGFGIGGIDTHIILEEYIDNNTYEESKRPELLVISGKSKENLESYEKNILNFAQNNYKDLSKIAFTLQKGRKQFEYCKAMIVEIIDGKLKVLYEAEDHISEEAYELNSTKKTEITPYNGEYDEKYVEYLKEYAAKFLEGYDVDWDNLYDLDNIKKISIPKYCFKKNVFNYFAKSENQFIITLRDVEKIKKIEIEQEKIECMLTEDNFKGIDDVYKKIPIYAAANYFNRHNIYYGKSYDIEEICKETNIIPQYEKFFKYLLNILVQNKLAYIENSSVRISKKITEMDITKVVDDAKKAYPEFAMKFDFILNCINEYDAVFTGKKEGNSVLYPEGKYDTILEIGAHTPDISREPIYINSFPKVLRHFIEKNNNISTVKILELGSGTGIITWPILEELKDLNVEYYFTDLGKSFITLAKEKVKEKNYKNVVFRQYNIEKNYGEQGFESESFDFVISMNVLQVSHNLKDSIEKVAGILKKDGLFACVQAFISEDINYLTYGYAPGWWNYEEDPIRTGKNIMLSHEDWKEMLEKLQFKNINIIYDSLKGKNDKFGFIFANRPNNVKLFENTNILNNDGLKENSCINSEDSRGTKENNLINEIIEMIEDTIGEELTIESSLINAGFDSLSLLILSSQMKERFDVNLSVKKLYEFNNINELINYIKDYLTFSNTETVEENLVEQTVDDSKKDINNLLYELENL